MDRCEEGRFVVSPVSGSRGREKRYLCILHPPPAVPLSTLISSNPVSSSVRPPYPRLGRGGSQLPTPLDAQCPSIPSGVFVSWYSCCAIIIPFYQRSGIKPDSTLPPKGPASQNLFSSQQFPAGLRTPPGIEWK
eukprot:EG_transcript_18525